MSKRCDGDLLAGLLLGRRDGDAGTVRPAPACPFCIDERGKTLVDDYLDSSLVIFGSFKNAKPDKQGGTDNGTSELHIEKVLKSNDIIKGKKLVTLPKYVPASKSKWIVFCDVYKGEVNPYRGEEVVPGSQLLEYLNSSLAHQGRKNRQTAAPLLRFPEQQRLGRLGRRLPRIRQSRLRAVQGNCQGTAGRHACRLAAG